MDGRRSEQVDGLSKLTKVEDLRSLIFEKFDVDASRQRLFFRGKQLENGHSLFDYNVNRNDIVQLLIRQLPQEIDQLEKKVNTNEKPAVAETPKVVISAVDPKHNPAALYQVDTKVDVRDERSGAWFEATVVKVTSEVSKKDDVEEDKENRPPTPTKDEKETQQTMLYHAKYDDYDETHIAKSSCIRPRARKLIKWGDIKESDTVMLNHNLDDPKLRGFWYDAVILEKKEKRNYKELIAKLILGVDRVISPCKCIFVEEVFAIEKVGEESCALDSAESTERNSENWNCNGCGDNPRRDCKECGCHVCGKKKDFDKTLLCDECNLPYHTYCLDPPIENINDLPEDEDWYCPLCKNDDSEVVKAGEKLKASKKKEKMKSFTSDTKRDWGKGMACVGRTKKCTIVPTNHVGPIPGIPVGTLWKFRVQASEDGVHRPHVSGIHGGATEGAFSVVLAGGYEDDKDDGDEFFYTGSGGRDLSGNKRTAEQSSDQVLTKGNMAIARTCDAKLDAKNGAEAKDWKITRYSCNTELQGSKTQ